MRVAAVTGFIDLPRQGGEVSPQNVIASIRLSGERPDFDELPRAASAGRVERMAARRVDVLDVNR
jgi:hypothetical protein